MVQIMNTILVAHFESGKLHFLPMVSSAKVVQPLNQTTTVTKLVMFKSLKQFGDVVDHLNNSETFLTDFRPSSPFDIW